MNSTLIYSMLLGFGVTALLLQSLRRVALHINLVDTPDVRKDHVGAIPLIGGLAMFIGFSFAILLLEIPINHLRSFFAGCMILIIVGVLDDLRELSSYVRFAAQIIAAFIMIEFGNVQLIDFGAIGTSVEPVQLGIYAVPLTIFATVGVINALNMIDGLNGLAGLVSLITTLSMVLLCWIAGSIDSAQILLLLATVIIAFLLFNCRYHAGKTALAFMGDAGSMFLGFVLCWYFIQLSQGEQRIMSPVTALWIFAVPLIDTVTMMLRRILKRRSPFSADQEHVHHLLLKAGFNHLETVMIIFLIAITFAAIGIAAYLSGYSEARLFVIFLACFAIYFFMTLHAWKFMRFLKWIKN
ncbi:MAG: undecaprenyl/decaprenyl-phosphate alpha-N-acetylglucosaminyl 1-phosphate transferase [Gammaproteobacteria bacterium]|nr:MAG: undecaprenyl/decaprenyl-phosphate alpha-N-acetylglucosaminyl 1-phosphate transferase [Gammaproteobacteria bacterium]